MKRYAWVKMLGHWEIAEVLALNGPASNRFKVVGGTLSNVLEYRLIPSPEEMENIISYLEEFASELNDTEGGPSGYGDPYEKADDINGLIAKMENHDCRA